MGRRFWWLLYPRRLSLPPCAAPSPRLQASSAPPPPSYVPPSVFVSPSPASCALLPSSFARPVPPLAFPATGRLGWPIGQFLCGSPFSLGSDGLVQVVVQRLLGFYTNATSLVVSGSLSSSYLLRASSSSSSEDSESPSGSTTIR